MTLKVFGLPTPQMASQNDKLGISQVILNLAPILRDQYDIELVNHENEADLIAHHAGQGDGQTDVAICHGLYPTGMPNFSKDKMYQGMNARVIKDLIGAKEIIVPSQWVADMIVRNLKRVPTVVTWGVHTGQWNFKRDKQHILWNKNRPSDVCTTEWVDRLARDFPHLPFVSTFSQTNPQNMQVTGQIPHADMKPLIETSLVYLATTKETGDIGSKEALASGVPVLGFRHGALPDFIEHGVNGFLAEPDDYDGLKKGLDWLLDHHKTVAANALQSAKQLTWEQCAQDVANVLVQAANQPAHPIPVTVVIPCHNYANYVGAAIHSVIDQQFNHPFKLIVVDDGSSDNSVQVITDAAKGATQKNPMLADVQLIKLSPNAGVANARNTGILHTNSPYIVCLDADDMIAPNYLQTCFDAMQADHTIGVAYTRLQTIGGGVSQWMEGEFNIIDQLKGYNQVPTCCMFKREGWQAVGGYVQDKHPAEDADLWTRLAVHGWTPRKVTDQALFYYRRHKDSASSNLSPVDWMAGKGWYPDAIPFGAQLSSQPVFNYDQPAISVIIPVGDAHRQVWVDAIRSVEAQSFWNWEMVVIDDTTEGLQDAISRVLPVRVVRNTNRGAGAARNAGIRAARADTLLFLDADDLLTANALEVMYFKHRQTGDYIYSDWFVLGDGRNYERMNALDFETNLIWDSGMFHPITIMVNRQHVLDIGGFDETLPSWEDTDFMLKLIASGTCGSRVTQPLLVYRVDLGARREIGVGMSDTLKATFRDRYQHAYEGGQIVCNCLNKGKGDVPAEKGAMVFVELVTGGKGNTRIRGSATKQFYGGRKQGDRFYIYAADLDYRFQPVQEFADLPTRQTEIPA